MITWCDLYLFHVSILSLLFAWCWSNIRICYICLNRSAWRRRRSCPKTWARQPPSFSSFSKPLRSSWPKRETQWEHYRSTWRARWDTWHARTTHTNLYYMLFWYACQFWHFISVFKGEYVELKEGTSVWKEAHCRHYEKLPNMPYDYHSYAFQNNVFLVL